MPPWSSLDAHQVLRIYDGATLLGNATVTGTTWTFVTPTLADASQHAYTASVANAADQQGTASSAFALTVSSPYERLVNASITGDAMVWTLNATASGGGYPT